MNTDGWWADAFDSQEDVMRRIAEYLPSLQDQAEDGTAPVVRVECPKGHQLLYVTARVASSEGFALVATNRAGKVREDYAATALEVRTPNEVATGYALPERFNLRCTKCRFAVLTRDTELLKRYAVAVGLAKLAIPLVP